jgi:hypothetical protein
MREGNPHAQEQRRPRGGVGAHEVAFCAAPGRVRQLLAFVEAPIIPPWDAVAPVCVNRPTQ